MNTIVYLLSTLLLSLLITFNVKANNYEDALKAFNQEKFQSAYIHLKNQLKENPDHIPAKILMGRILLKNGYVIDAENILFEALTLGGDLEYILEPLGKSLLRLNKPQEIFALLKNKQLSNKSLVTAHLLKGQAFELLEDKSKALQQYALANKYSQEQAETLNILAAFYIKQNKIDNAEQLIEKSLIRDIENARTWHLKGLLLELKSHYVEATKAYEKSLSINNQAIDPQRALASLYIDTYQDEQALVTIDQVLKKAPYDPRAKLLKANLLLKKNNDSLAKEILQTLNQQISVLSEDTITNNQWIIYINGITSYLLGNYEFSIRELNEFLQYEPENFAAATMVAKAYIKLDQPSFARSVLDKYTSNVAKNIEIALLLCDLYIKNRTLFKCDDLLNSATVEFPDDNRIVLMKARLLVSQNNVTNAISLLEPLITSTAEQDIAVSNYLINLYLKTNQNKKAINFIYRLLTQDKDNQYLANAMAGALIKIGETKRAEILVLDILKHHPDDFAANHNYASALLEQRKAQQAKAILKKILMQQPTNAESLVLLAKAEASLGNAQDAINILQIAVKSNITHVAANEMLIYLLKLSGGYEQALRTAKQFYQYDRLSVKFLQDKAEIYIGLNNREQAIKQLNILFEQWIAQPKNLIKLSQIQRHASDFNGAKKSLLQAQKLAPKSPVVNLALARLNIYQKDIEAAEKTLSKLTGNNKNNAKVLMTKADLYLAKGQAQSAQTSYLKAFEIDTTNGMALAKAYNLATIGYLSQEFEQQLVKAIEQQPRNFYYLNMYADFLLNNQQFDAAHQQYLKLLKTKQLPNRADVLNNLANAVMHADLSMAEKYAMDARTIKPNASYILDTYGWILAKQERYEAALTVLRQAQFLKAGDSLVHYHLAYTLYKLDRSNEAIAELQTALAPNAEFDGKPQAEQLLAQLTSPQ